MHNAAYCRQHRAGRRRTVGLAQMTGGLFPVLLLMLVAWIWVTGARAREFATQLARRHCRQRQLQFLDETVALARMGIRWTSEGIRMRRMYRFEFSLEGVGRRTAYILTIGNRLEAIDDGLDVEEGEPEAEPTRDAETDEPATRDNKVVPFRRRDD